MNTINKVTDKELIKRIKQGEISSKMELYRRYHLPVFEVARRILQDRVIAEDVTHETMIVAFDKLSQLNDHTKIRSWLCTIARNEALNEVRRRRKIHFEDMSYPEISDQEDHDFTSNWSVEEILKEIERLPDGYRLIVNLHLLDGLSHEEIAKDLEISASTSRSQYLRAKARLRQQMINTDERSTETTL